MNIEELARRTGLDKRTIRYYIQRKLVRGPIGIGRRAVYDEDHEWTLNMVTKFKQEGMTLRQIYAWFNQTEKRIRAYEQSKREDWLRYSIRSDVELHVRRQVEDEDKDMITRIIGVIAIMCDERDHKKK